MFKKDRKLTPITDLFEKYKRTLKAPQGVVVDSFIEVTEDVLGFRIPKERIRYAVATKTLSVQVSGPLKSEIKLHQTEIMAHLKGRLGVGNAPREIL